MWCGLATGARPVVVRGGLYRYVRNPMYLSVLTALAGEAPLFRVLRYRLRQGSGGTGYSPGGEGIERDLQLLEDCTVSLITERRVSRPWGLWGGEPGAVGENWLLPAGDESRVERLPDKCTLRLHVGDVVRMLTPGGGGWGPE